jgi:hypothetical protein
MSDSNGLSEIRVAGLAMINQPRPHAASTVLVSMTVSGVDDSHAVP